MGRPHVLDGMLREKREVGELEAERWATAFEGECRSGACPHTAAEHGDARLFLAGTYRRVLAELRASRQKMPPCPSHPRYLAVRPPRVPCTGCWRAYIERNP